MARITRLGDVMPNFTVKYLGRKAGAIGIFYDMTMQVAAANSIEARERFWDVLDHDKVEVHHIIQVFLSV